MLNFENKTVLITGGSRGIGAACVKMFSGAGADVAFTYNTNKNAAEEVIKIVSSERIIKAYEIKIDSEESVNSIVKQIKNDFGKIDILINNAGIWEKGDIDSMTLQQWNETININLTGTFLITREISALMKKNKYGRIINVTSTAGQRGEAHYSHYASSKGAVISMTKSLAVELARFNITVNSVAPGWVITDMTNNVFKDLHYKKEVEMSIPVGRIATAEDIAGPILFLASDLARHINGEILNVNGGSVLCG